MNYEKAYKAVLQTAKQWIKDGCTDKERICLECVFPELRENEDERVRKEIIDFIQWAEERGMTRHDYHQAKRPSEWTAYLEKQKEQKHPDGCFTCGEYKKGYEEGRRNGFTAGYNKAIKEVEQKEQKSAEWSKNDTVFLNEITDFFENKTVRLQHDIDMYAHWLKSLPERFNFQPKEEWSEEDEHRITDAIYFLESAKIHYADTSEIEETIAWLNSLPERFNLPSKQEWSEEDEKAFKRAIDCVRSWEIDYCDGDNRISERLKSLNPSWKPSEEQMDALKELIDDANRAGWVTPGATELYEQLKKLI